jgi:hypothetical protein
VSERFWETKTLAEMSDQEWESLCDGCARCCMVKLEDEDTGEIHFTSVVCHLLDDDTCQCSRYPQRHELVDDCIQIDAQNIATVRWLPGSCAYRRLSEGRGLADWHPLISGSPASVVEAGMSVRGNVVSEAAVHPSELESHIIRWVTV